MKGAVRKMRTYLNTDGKVKYELPLLNQARDKSTLISMNLLIGKRITMTFEGAIFCKSCGVQTKKSFMGGFCYKCFTNSPEAAPCIIRPELCQAHEGKGRDVEWEEQNHNQPHFVYLAATDVIKVGVTRATQVPTRWVDQGASSAIRLAETPNRYLAGVIEVALKDLFTDKTNWRKMLKNEIDTELDLEATKWELEEQLPEDISQYFSEDDEIISIDYPVTQYPEKVKSISFDKQPKIEGTLLGIKGQYLLLDDDRVLNMRKHTGYEINFTVK